MWTFHFALNTTFSSGIWYGMILRIMHIILHILQIICCLFFQLWQHQGSRPAAALHSRAAPTSWLAMKLRTASPCCEPPRRRTPAPLPPRARASWRPPPPQCSKKKSWFTGTNLETNQ
jgi:hypothetical protein